jgi:AraC-like DNA-binding protein/mannose-6-phosphate isomerase-like protein (cupin superfamily)
MPYNDKISHVEKESIYNNQNAKSWVRVKRFYAMNFDFFEMEPHAHKEFEIMYVASGTCIIKHWSATKELREYILREGEYAFFDCNVMHQLIVERGTPCRILNLEISLENSMDDFNFLLLEKSNSYQDFLKRSVSIIKGYDDAGSLHTIISELHKQLQNPAEEGEHRIMQNLILAQFLVEIGRQYTKKNDIEGGSRYVRKALQYISDNFDQEIKIHEIAEDTGISSAYLQRLFKEQTGKTLVDKINELRIEKAKLLLETSRLPVIDIAVSVGFNNRQHFTYTFFKLTGSSPAVYRKHKGDYHVWKGF